jgi:hypothetical protein
MSKVERLDPKPLDWNSARRRLAGARRYFSARACVKQAAWGQAAPPKGPAQTKTRMDQRWNGLTPSRWIGTQRVVDSLALAATWGQAAAPRDSRLPLRSFVLAELRGEAGVFGDEPLFLRAEIFHQLADRFAHLRDLLVVRARWQHG